MNVASLFASLALGSASLGCLTACCGQAGDEGKQWPDEPLRGINTNIEIKTDSGLLDESYFQKMKEWNVNLLRVAISVDKDSPWSKASDKGLPPIPADDPMRPYAKGLQGLAKALELAEKYHIYIIPALSDVVGRKNDVMFKRKDDASFYSDIASVWVHIAKQHGRSKWLLAYDILNEPNGENAKVWTDKVALETVAKIRAVDKETYIVYEPAPWALPDQAFESVKPLDDPKVVYSFHFYYPHTYTHQGIGGYTGDEFKNKAYPGKLKIFPGSSAKDWDKAALEKSMANAIEFQRRYGVKIFVGEFGVLRWAPGGDKWLADAISVFESHGWTWTFHSYGEWNGWNPTFPADAKTSNDVDGGAGTPNLKIMLESWRLNKPL